MRTCYISSKSFFTSSPVPLIQHMDSRIMIPTKASPLQWNEMRAGSWIQVAPLLNVTSTRSITIMVSTPSVLPNSIPSLLWSLLCYWDITKTEKETMSTVYLKLKQLKPLTAQLSYTPVFVFCFFCQVHLANLNLLMLVTSDVWCHIKTWSTMRAHV